MATRQPTKIVDLLAILLAPFNEIETAFQDLLLKRTIDNAVGDALDTLGKIVGQPRIGPAIGDDDTYRRFVRARVAANRSNGVGDDLIRVVQLALADLLPTLDVHVYPGEVNGHGIATVIVQIEAVAITETIATVLLILLQASVSAGVRLVLRYPISPPAGAFRLDAGPGLDVGHLYAGVDAG